MNGSPTAVVDPLGLAICTSITRTREQALQDARVRAGLPPNAEPVDTFVKRPGLYGDQKTGQIEFNNTLSIAEIRSRLGALGPVEVHFNPNDPSNSTVVVIANHSSDPTRPAHVHAGTIPESNPMGTYDVITPPGGDHHIYYGPIE